MCVVSAVGDYYQGDFEKKWPNIYDEVFTPTSFPGTPSVPNTYIPVDLSKLATKEDIAQIRAELLELKTLLKAAIKFDEVTEQEHCENEEKIALIKRIADLVGVDMTDLNLND